MKTPKAPAPTDPKATAAAQTATNIGTAVANQAGSLVNQQTPQGSLTYNRTSTYHYTDPLDGKVYEIPQYTAVQTYSPQEQALYDLGNQTEQNIARIGVNQSAAIGQHLSTPIDLNNETTEARLMDLGRKRLDPALRDRRSDLESRLTEQGIRQGSAAHDRAMLGLIQSENDAYNQLLLQGRGLAVQEALTARNQPINEITALLTGSQVSQPNYVSAPGLGAPTTDYAGIVANYDNARMNAWLANQQSRNSTLGGLFSLGASGIRTLGPLAFSSDRRLKKDIMRVGSAGNGLPLYLFRYRDEPSGAPFRLGLMADDVAAVRPEAVLVADTGFAMVDYEAALA